MDRRVFYRYHFMGNELKHMPQKSPAKKLQPFFSIEEKYDLQMLTHIQGNY